MLISENILTEFIAIAVGPRGFNCTVEYSANSSVPEVQLRQTLREVLTKIDHKTVGRDLQIHGGNSTVNLNEVTQWMFNELALKVPESKSLVLRFGNGITCEARA